MAYLALYREWRPQTFADVVGQPHIVRTLQNALRTGRLAHAYLFTGPRGTGKTSTAKILAKAINCERGPAEEPCNECPACRGIAEGSVMDVVEIDAASNRGIDEIRDLREQVRYVPTQVRYKVYIVDEVHMLTPEAFNALLKTLEEPPEHVIFILATTEPHKLPATIISRCQRFAFQRILARDVADRMKYILSRKGRKAEDKALWLIARAADGGLRDALSLLDQALAFSDEVLREADVLALLGRMPGEDLVQGIEALACGDAAAALLWCREQLDRGYDVGPLAAALLDYLRDMLWVQTAPDHPEIRERIQYEPALKELAERVAQQRVLEWMNDLTEMQQQLRWYTHPRLLLELTLAKLCTGRTASEGAVAGGGMESAISDLASRLDRLEQQVRLLSSRSATEVPLGEPGLGKAERTASSKQGESETAKRAAVGGGGTEQGMKSASSPAAPASPAAERRASGAGTPSTVSSARWEDVRAQLDPEAVEPVRARWQEVLDEVKKRRVTTQAWLLDGEPVARAGTWLVVAFKNQIHRETVMKPMHRTVIEDVLRSLFGEQMFLYAVPVFVWQQEMAAREQSTALQDPEAAEPGSSDAGMGANDPLAQLIELFGEDKVEILEEE